MSVELSTGFEMIKNDGRPILSLNINGNDVKCLLDTGANIPVFTIGIHQFESFFPYARAVGKTRIGGFGGSGSFSILYKIPRLFILDDLGRYISYKDFYICASDLKNKSFDILLSGSLFLDCILTVDYIKRLIDMRFNASSYEVRMNKYGLIEVFSQDLTDEDTANIAAAFRSLYDDIRR